MPIPRHKTSADAFPAKTPGKVRLYNMHYCPFALRAVIMLTKKGVDFEVINIHLRDKPAWFLEKYSVGTVPVFEQDDKILGESLVITEYVDEAFEGEKIISTDPYRRARTKMLLANEFPKAITSIYGMLGRKENWKEGLEEHVGKLETILKCQNYFEGDKKGYGDYMIFPWLRYIGLKEDEGELVRGNLPNINRWLCEMNKDETIQKCNNPLPALKRFVKVYYTQEFEVDFEDDLI